MDDKARKWLDLAPKKNHASNPGRTRIILCNVSSSSPAMFNMKNVSSRHFSQGPVEVSFMHIEKKYYSNFARLAPKQKTV